MRATEGGVAISCFGFHQGLTDASVHNAGVLALIEKKGLRRGSLSGLKISVWLPINQSNSGGENKAWWTILILTVFLTVLNPARQKQEKPYFRAHHIEDLNVVFMDKGTINTWWKMIGGQEEWEKVHAFSYYDHNRDTYYIILPPNANHRLIGYEFSHILDWTREKRKTQPLAKYEREIRSRDINFKANGKSK